MGPMKKVEYIAVHCSATPADMDIGRQEIDRWHRLAGYEMVGYHWIIRRDGTVEVGRPIDRVGGHVYGFNDRAVGICMVGGTNKKNKKAENNFTEAQFASLKSVLESMKALFPDAVIQGHRDFPNVKKDCPSFDVKKWVSENMK